MQNYTPPGGWGPVLHFLHENRMAIQGALRCGLFLLLTITSKVGSRSSSNLLHIKLARRYYSVAVTHYLLLGNTFCPLLSRDIGEK